MHCKVYFYAIASMTKVQNLEAYKNAFSQKICFSVQMIDQFSYCFKISVDYITVFVWLFFVKTFQVL